MLILAVLLMLVVLLSRTALVGLGEDAASEEVTMTVDSAGGALLLLFDVMIAVL